MSTAVRISHKLVDDAKVISKVENRSVTGQIEYWAKIGKIAEENPTMSFQLIKEILFGLEELDRGKGIDYNFGWMPVKVIQSPSFAKRVKKFKKSQKEQLDKQIRLIINDPKIGEAKKGDLKGVFVQKFKIDNLQYLLSYRFKKDLLELIMIGPHENYYRDLKSYLKHR